MLARGRVLVLWQEQPFQNGSWGAKALTLKVLWWFSSPGRGHAKLKSHSRSHAQEEQLC
jgi:hypothetical protein